MTLLCGQSLNLRGQSTRQLDVINFISYTDDIQGVSARTFGGKVAF